MKNKKLLFLLFVILGITLFYWFQWRPTEIRKECHRYAVDKAIEDSGSNDKTFKDGDYKFRLQYCLQREGLK